MTIHEFLNFFDFALEKYDNQYGVIDCQGANLGDIESERFDTIAEVVERFCESIYIPDYIIDDVEKQADKTFDSYEDMYQWCKENGDDYHGDILYALINPKSVREEII